MPAKSSKATSSAATKGVNKSGRKALTDAQHLAAGKTAEWIAANKARVENQRLKRAAARAEAAAAKEEAKAKKKADKMAAKKQKILDDHMDAMIAGDSMNLLSYLKSMKRIHMRTHKVESRSIQLKHRPDEREV